ncbi:MAG: extracellular solute-binding protein [Methanomicrobiaceae archaeon]|nr:extracellular solute-binding protein [Methanomicrobiaceae archaeon]
MFKKMFENESAVSPIVATLVLIVVAVVGAVAVGTIMGTFSSDVAEQNNAGDVAGASATEILIAGSTTVQPASEALAKEYMKKHPGIKITVQGGGSGAGVAAAGQGIADLGSASRGLKSQETDQWPLLETYQIGGSGVAIVVPDNSVITGVTKEGLKELYAQTITNNAATVGWTDANTNGVIETTELGAVGAPAVTITVYQRAEASGTEETVAKEYLKYAGDNFDATKAKGETGNTGVADAIAAGSVTDERLGFIDFGYVTTDHKALTVDGKTCDEDHILESLKGTPDSDVDSYIEKLARPLNYVINGQPNSVVKNYIEFCQSPEGKAVIESDDVGMFGLLSFTSF